MLSTVSQCRQEYGVLCTSIHQHTRPEADYPPETPLWLQHPSLALQRIRLAVTELFSDGNYSDKLPHVKHVHH